MRNKKAIVAAEYVKMVLAVIVLILLIYLMVKLYGLFRTKTAYEQAQETLKQLIAKIKYAEQNWVDDKSESYLIVGPKNWFLTIFNEEIDIQQHCAVSGKSCLCISKDEQIICQPSDFKVEFLGYSRSATNSYSVVKRQTMPLDKASQEIFLQKKGDKILIYTETEKGLFTLFNQFLAIDCFQGTISCEKQIKMLVESLKKAKENEGKDKEADKAYGRSIKNQEDSIKTAAVNFLKDNYPQDKNIFQLKITYKDLVNIEQQEEIQILGIYAPVPGDSIDQNQNQITGFEAAELEIDDLEGKNKIKIMLEHYSLN